MAKTKKIITRILAAAIATVVGLTPIASNVNVNAWGTPINSGIIHMTDSSSSAQLFNSSNEADTISCNAKAVERDGIWVPVYCIEKGKSLNTGDTVNAEMYENGDWSDQYGMTVRDAIGMIYICGYNGENGWGVTDFNIYNRDASGDELMANGNYQKYVATQALIWEVVSGNTYYSRNDSIQGEINVLRGRISNYINRSVRGVDSSGDITVYRSSSDAQANPNAPTTIEGNGTAHFAYSYGDYNPSNSRDHSGPVANYSSSDITSTTINEVITFEWKRIYNGGVEAGQGGEVIYDLDSNDAANLWGVILWRPENGNQLCVSATATAEKVYASFLFDYTQEEFRARATISTTKIDDLGNPSRGATFTVYDSNGNSIGTMSDPENNGHYTYSLAQSVFADAGNVYYDKDSNGNEITENIIRSFTVQETSPATEVLVDGSWRSATFAADDTTYSINITLVRSSGEMTWTATGTAGGSASRNARMTTGDISFGTPNHNGNTVNYSYVYADADITIHKVDDQGRPARGATFTVYSDSACNRPVGLMHDDENNGQYVFDEFDFTGSLRTGGSQTNTFYIIENEPANEVLFNGQWISIECQLDPTVRKVTVTWNPSNGTINAELSEGNTVLSTIPGSYDATSQTSTVHGDFVANPAVNPISSTGSMLIEKYDEETGERLTGATFRVYNDVNDNGSYNEGTDTVYCETLTDDDGDGIYTLEGMPLDHSYLVIETEAPEYYETDPNYYGFRLDPEVRSYTVDNMSWTPIEGVAGEFLNHNPITRTTLTDAETLTHVTVVRENITLVDTVEYNGLHVGETYVMEGTLYDKASGEVITTAQVTFTPENEAGTVNVTFTVNTEVARSCTFVAGEKVRHEDSEKYVGIHFDLEDEPQTVRVPDIHTTLTDNSTNDHVVAYPTVELTDVISYENLTVGLEYTISGYLMDKNTNEPLTDSEGNIISSIVTFTPEEQNGQVEVTFTFNRALADNKTLVAFESLYYGDVLIIAHEDIDDVDQTVYLPQIHTTLLGSDTNEHVAAQSGRITLVDTVTYSNLLPGKTYALTGTLVNRDTGDFLRDTDGNSIASTVEFTAESTSGTVDVIFTLDSSVLNGVTLVAFEELAYNNITIATHNDINDIDQTVNIPDIGTTLYDKEFVDNPEMREMTRGYTEVTLIDTVSYENITPNLEYTVYGTLMIKETGEVLRDADGNTVTASTTFIPESPSGSVDVTFTVSLSELGNRHIVAFETLEYNNVAIVIHADLSDENQTVRVPEIGTTLLDDITQAHVGHNAETIILTDIVSYTGLVPGKTYTVTGCLVNKDTGMFIIGADMDPITATTEFVAENANGFVEIDFEINSLLLEGVSVVAFESVNYLDCPIAIHADIEDEGQTVHFPSIGTNATVDGEKTFTAADSITLTDTVSYTNLVPGRTYELRGILMTSAGVVFAPEGTAATASFRFTPETATGTVDVMFVFNGNDLKAGDRLVVFEQLYLVSELVGPDGITSEELYLITTHEDLSDEGQTVTVVETPNGPGIPSTGEESSLSTTLGLIAVVIGGCIAAVIVYRKKNDD